MENNQEKTTSQKKIIVAPLDWGLGHATRCIPIIRYLLEKNCEVLIVSSGRSLLLLQSEFPHLKAYNVPAYNIEYQRKGNFILKIVFQLFKVFRGIRDEHVQIEKIIFNENPDFIISDNRYGLYSRKVKSIIISHQIMVKIPSFSILEPIVKIWLFQRHKKFDALWIPDVEAEPNISGDLGHKGHIHKNTKYIGALTRFETANVKSISDGTVLVILSGPEPQRTILEEIILQQAGDLPYAFIIVQGKSEINEERQIGNIKVISYCNASDLNNLALNAEIIISRGGYSTLMDLSTLHKKCIFIPTPGQTEQEYLVKTLSDKKLIVKANQNDLRLGDLIDDINRNNIRFYIPSDTTFFKQLVNTELL